jgi:hypothetical protein
MCFEMLPRNSTDLQSLARREMPKRAKLNVRRARNRYRRSLQFDARFTRHFARLTVRSVSGPCVKADLRASIFKNTCFMSRNTLPNIVKVNIRRQLLLLAAAAAVMSCFALAGIIIKIIA